MFDIGWSELLLIGIVALIVIGPKDLPGMFRTLGRFTAKARAMGREFQRAMDDAARESGVKETTDELRAMTSKKNLGLDALEKAASKFEKWEPTKSSTPKGPATQALADKRAAEAEARKAAAKPAAADTPAIPAKAEASATPAKVAAKPKAPAKPRAAAKPKAPAKPKAAASSAGKPAAGKPRAKKGGA